MVFTDFLYLVGFCIIATICHEAGHYITACFVGLKPDQLKLGVGNTTILKYGGLEITALPVSGMVRWQDGRLQNAPIKTQRIIAAGGPGINLIIGLVSLPICLPFSLVNFWATLWNLIPVNLAGQFSDGGYIFQKGVRI